jgi:integrase
VDAAGVSWATPYTGRRTYISLMIHAGVSPVVVAASVGHTSGETIWKHYARMFDGARTTEAVPMDRAVRAARRAARRSGLAQVSAESNVIALRSRS